MIYLAVALGGALGALSRFGIGQWLADSGYAHLHPATFLVNVIGALLIGILFVGAERFTLSEPARLGMSVGFLGHLPRFQRFHCNFSRIFRRGRSACRVLRRCYGVPLPISCLVGMELARSVFD